MERLRLCHHNISLSLNTKRREKLYDSFKRSRKRTLNYTVVYRKTMLCSFNITFIQKVFYKFIPKSIKSLLLCKKLKNKWYVDKDILRKVRKCRLNIIFILNFCLQNRNNISKRIIDMYKNLREKNFSSTIVECQMKY